MHAAVFERSAASKAPLASKSIQPATKPGPVHATAREAAPPGSTVIDFGPSSLSSSSAPNVPPLPLASSPSAPADGAPPGSTESPSRVGGGVGPASAKAGSLTAVGPGAGGAPPASDGAMTCAASPKLAGASPPSIGTSAPNATTVRPVDVERIVALPLVAPSAYATTAGPSTHTLPPASTSVFVTPLSARLAAVEAAQPGVRSRSMIRHVALDATVASTLSFARDCSASATTRPPSANGWPPSVAEHAKSNVVAGFELEAGSATPLISVFDVPAPPTL